MIPSLILAQFLLTLSVATFARASDDLADCQKAADSTALGTDARELCQALPPSEASARFAEPKFRACLERGKRAGHGDFFRLQALNPSVTYGKPGYVLADCVRDAKSGANDAPAGNVRVLGELNIHTRDTSWPAGLSGLSYHSPSGEFVSISDTQVSPQAFHLRLRPGATPSESFDAAILRTRALEATIGNADHYPDHEDIAAFRDGDLLLSSERGKWPLRQLRTSACAPAEVPAALALPIPASFRPDGDVNNPAPTTGMAFNAGLEGIALAPSERYAILANEKPLVQDPALRVHLAVLELAASGGPRVGAIFDYTLDALPGTGISALTFADPSTLIVLERGFDLVALKNSIRLYSVSLRLDASGLPVATGEKRLLVDLEKLLPQFAPGFRALDNFEGMAFGPDVANGSRVLYLITDNNQNPNQRTLFLALEIRRDGALAGALAEAFPDNFFPGNWGRLSLK